MCSISLRFAWIQKFIFRISSLYYILSLWNIFDWIREEKLSRDEILDHYDECWFMFEHFLKCQRCVRLGHPSLPHPSFARPRTTQKDLVRNLVCLEPGHAAWGGEIMQKAVRGLLIAHELKITQKFPKIITINYQLPISALVLSAVEWVSLERHPRTLRTQSTYPNLIMQLR